MPVTALILRAPGTNCDEETAYAFELAGAQTQRVHVRQLLEEPGICKHSQILCLPGGFSYGDDIASGRILGDQLRRQLADTLREYRAANKLILGICNGFQVLIKCGLLFDDFEQSPATLAWNESGRYRDAWVNLRVQPGPCVFLRGLTEFPLPYAHGEGRFVARSPEVLAELARRGQLALCYAPGESKNVAARGDAHSEGGDLSVKLDFPDNPNGSQANVAGVCDSTGRVFGLMPHPERYITRTQHPCWTRGAGTEPGSGLAIFQNAVAAVG
ncbi:MAG: phosphoribosylformylglycinamidine synthase subunit PurQ [Pirellulales bacterium]|nr:phosphoribosylformylglycinamidine synthase subunit PurQ [Pirellulales bacterium]